MSQFRSNGKLLISGEYVVLDGALSLALPCKFGQNLNIEPNNSNFIVWTALKHTGQLWFFAKIKLQKASLLSAVCIQETSDKTKAETLINILLEAQKLNPGFLSTGEGYNVETLLEFPTDWGLGSSSTLINNIASWAKVDPYTLLWNSFSGSGYDIACAKNNTAVTYQLHQKKPIVQTVRFTPPFSENLFFVYLNKKQNSREGIQRYETFSIPEKKQTIVREISEITTKLTAAPSLESFEKLLQVHEKTIASIIQLTPVKEQLFNDYKGAIKSLGAWGGDFILVTGKANYVKDYFTERGFNTIVPFKNMVL